MRFIQTRSGTYINLDNVTRIEPREVSKAQREKLLRGEMPCYVFFTEDENVAPLGVQIFADELDAWAALIPAEPGYFSLHYWGGDIEHCPIVAWKISSEGKVYGAVALGEDSEHSEGQYILYPDGRVLNFFIQEWVSIESWYEEMAKAAAKDS